MPSPTPLDNSLGAAFIGILLSAIMYGITLLQIYSYFIHHSKDDGKSLKVFVLLLLVLDSSHLALVAHAVYWYTISNFGDYGVLLNEVWSLDAQVLVAHVLISLVQGFFARRIYILSRRRNWWLPTMIMALSSGMMATSIGYIVTSRRHPSISESYRSMPWTVGGLVVEVVADCLSMAGMIYYLGKDVYFARTKRAMSKLITYTVNTGILTTLCTIVTLVTYLANNQSKIYAPSYFVLVRMHACSFMSILNSRQAIRDEILGGTSTMPAQESIAFTNLGNGRPTTGTQVRVTAQTVTDGGYPTWAAMKGDSVEIV